MKECSVLGASFPRQAIEAVSDTDPADLDELLSSLVRKEVLTVRADKLSPERGQYAFTQSLIRSVAYDMLTRAERKARHLRTAEHLRTAFPDEGAEVCRGDRRPPLRRLPGRRRRSGRRGAPGPGVPGLCAGRRAGRVRRRPGGGRVRLPEGGRAELRRGRAGRLRSSGPGRWPSSPAGTNAPSTTSRSAIAAHAEAGRVVDAARVTAWLGDARSRLSAAASRDHPDPRGAGVARGDRRPAGGARRSSGRGSAALSCSPATATRRAVANEEALTLAQHHELADPLVRRLNSKAMLHSVRDAPRRRACSSRVPPSSPGSTGSLTSEMFGGRQPRRPLHDPATSRAPKSTPRRRSALARRWGLRERRGRGGQQPHVHPHDGGPSSTRRAELGTELLEAAATSVPGPETSTSGSPVWRRFAATLDAAREHLARLP